MATRRKADSYCLSIESTADNFSVGILSFKGEILAYQHGLSTPIEKNFVRLKWRLDNVYAPWVGG